MDNQIVCPNCGAPNESTSTSCHFCGASLTRARAKANQQEAPENENSSSKVSVKEVKGKPQIKFDKRIFNLNYDEFKDEAELYLSYDIVSLENKFRNYDYNFNLNRLWLGRIKTIISDGLRYDFYDSISITTDNLDLLETFCNLNLKDCRISEVSEGKEILFVLVCRAFYNTIFDHSKYTDAADKLYGYYLQSDEYKRKVEKDGRFSYDKHKIFLYKEDFDKFTESLQEVINFIKEKSPAINNASDYTSDSAEEASEKERSNSFSDVDFDQL